MTPKAAAHSHASQFSIYDLPMVSVSSLIINSSEQLMLMNSFEYSYQHGWMSQCVTGVTGIHSWL